MVFIFDRHVTRSFFLPVNDTRNATRYDRKPDAMMMTVIYLSTVVKTRSPFERDAVDRTMGFTRGTLLIKRVFTSGQFSGKHVKTVSKKNANAREDVRTTATSGKRPQTVRRAKIFMFRAA